jgi:hypothetical protein
LSNDLAELQIRMTAIEEEQVIIREQTLKAVLAVQAFEPLRKDVADLRTAFDQQRKLLNTIGRVQSDQHSVLLRHGEAIGSLALEVTEIRKTQVEHGQALAEHSLLLTEHGQTLRLILERLPAHEN